MPPENQKDSEFLALPSGLPIDYYDPVFFNSQQPRIRNRIASLKISFLPNVELSFTGHPHERLSDAEFLEKYGTMVMARYTQDDLAALEDGEWINDEDIDDDMDDDYAEELETGPTIGANGANMELAHRQQLVAHLSDDI